MYQTISRSLKIKNLIRLKTGLSVLARWTFVYTNVISLLPPCSRQEGVASEGGSLEIKDFRHGT